MGWASGNLVFDPVCRHVLELVHGGDLEEVVGQEVLEQLIQALQDVGWDTEDESLAEFRDNLMVVMAFAACDVGLIREEASEQT